MGKIIEMRQRKENNGYTNLIAFFEVCISVEACDFYLDVAELMYNKGKLSEKEILTLRRKGRLKRKTLSI